MYYITVTYFSSKAGIAEGFSCFNWPKIDDMFNLLTAGPEYIQFLIFYYHFKYHLLNMLE